MTISPLLVASILAVAATQAARATADPDDTGQGWRPVRLDMALSLMPGEGLLGVEGQLTLELQGPASLGPTLALGDPMQMRSLTAPGRPRVDIGVSVPTMPEVNLSHVRFSAPFETGARLTLSFLVENEGTDSGLLVNEQIALTNWPSAWYPLPIPDQGQGLSESLLASTGTTTLHMPPGWSSITNGRRTER